MGSTSSRSTGWRAALVRHARFVDRVFTEAEREYCLSRAIPAQHFAARFAGKEAVGKALGFGVPFTWREIEITGRPKPVVIALRAHRGLGRARAAGAIDLSMTHSKGMAGGRRHRARRGRRLMELDPLYDGRRDAAARVARHRPAGHRRRSC